MDAQSGANYQPNQSPLPQMPPQEPPQPTVPSTPTSAPFQVAAAPAVPPSQAENAQSTPSVPPMEQADTRQPSADEQSAADQPYDQSNDQPGEDYPMDDATLPTYLKPQVEEVVYAWQAPSRPFKQRKRRYFTTVITIALLISLILFFAGQFLPIAVVVAVAFLSYVMATIPPHTVTHQLTTYGIRLEDELYYWEEMGWFWFTTRYGQRILNIEIGRFPNRLVLLLGDASEDDIRYLLEAVLVENTPPPTYYERAAAWIQEKIPLDVE